MDFLYPCSLCSQTFSSRKQFLMHMTNVHDGSTVPSINTDKSKSLVSCAQCYRRFSNKGLLSKHVRLKHNNSTQNLITTFTSSPEEEKVSEELNASLLKDFLPDNYTYKILAFKDLLFGKFKAKFQIINMDIEQFLDWLNNLCHKSKVEYTTGQISSSIKYGHRKMYKCKNIDYWNNEILQNPTNCKASLSVFIKHLSKELAHESKATIIMNHCHHHPMNYKTPLKLYPAISDVYIEITSFLQNDNSVAGALQMYRNKIIENQGKRHYFYLMDSGINPDVEFVYALYYMHIGMSKFTSLFTKRVESLVISMSYYNANMGSESAVFDLVENNIVAAIRTPLMRTVNFDTVLVCSTSSNSCKTWFLFGKNDKEIKMPIGVVTATDDKECMLKSGLNLWKQLGGRIKTVIVEFIHCNTFQSVFPEATVSISDYHFLLGLWKWLFDVTEKNNLNNDLDCFVELKKLVYSEHFIVNHSLDTDFALVLTDKYPNFKKFMQNIYRTGFLSYFPFDTNPCSTIFERKLIHHHTKSFSILQMFHFVFDEMELFYTNFSKDSSQQIILNDLECMGKKDDNFTYYRIDDKCSMFLVECGKHGTFFVDTDIGLCSCTIHNVGAPCNHQTFLSNCFSSKPELDQSKINSINDSKFNGINTNDKEEQNIDKTEFENILSEFQFVSSKIRDQLIIDPDYFKDSIQSFVSTLKNDLVSDESLFLACHSLKNTNQSNLDNNS